MGKKVLVIGGGGREHALAWKLRQSPRLGTLFVAPGNAGTASLGTNVDIKATDIQGLRKFALEQQIDLTVVGPDDPLAMGVVDIFQAANLPIFGPTKAASRIEASKAFSKRLMRECGVPTALFETYRSHSQALTAVRRYLADDSGNCSVVIKASGLALGKGAYVCHGLAEAEQALDEIMLARVHGHAGDEIIMEEFVGGPEVSIHAFCDGNSFQLFPPAQDHKSIGDDDQGPNTGGMGTIAPVPWFNHHHTVSENVVRPILAGLRETGSPFTGLLYPGLKILETGPMVLEFNARFGDPETQVYMRLLESDLLEIFEACVNGKLHEMNIEWQSGFTACIIMASAGYPSANYKRGVPISGIERAETLSGVVIFHAGTKQVGDELVTAGGRVLGVTAIGTSLRQALDRAYQAVDCIYFEGAQYRKDIGSKSLVV